MGLRVTTEFSWPAVQTFCDRLWQHKPKSHNRDRAFYEYLRLQPGLRPQEAPYCFVERDGTVEGMLAWFIYTYQGWRVYSGLNLYILPEMRQQLHGTLLLREWAKRGDIMFSASVRPSTTVFYERTGWTRLTTTFLWYPVRWWGVRYLWQRVPSRKSQFAVLRKQWKAKSQPSTAINTLTCEVSWNAPSECDAWFTKLKHHYFFLDRSAETHRWRYGGYVPVGDRYEHFVIKEAGGEMVGYAVARRSGSTLTVSEVLALPEWWDAVLARLIAYAQQQPGIASIILQTNFEPLLAAAVSNGFGPFKTAANFFKTSLEAAPALKTIRSSSFLVAPSDSDDFLN